MTYSQGMQKPRTNTLINSVDPGKHGWATTTDSAPGFYVDLREEPGPNFFVVDLRGEPRVVPTVPAPIPPQQAFIQTFTGKLIDALNLDIDLIDIQDIAHSLSQQCRFNGHCKEFYSVAQHCVYVSRQLPKEKKLAGLMHDGTETYLCDIPSPLKPFLLNYKQLELNASKKIEEKWFQGRDVLEDPEVKVADVRMLATEFRDLRAYNSPVAHWTALKNVEPYPNLVIRPWSAKKAERKFLEAFYALQHA